MKYIIGVLRHEEIGHAEEQIIAAGREKDVEIVIIDPFTITIGIQPDFICNHGKILKCDGIISRCEISSCLAAECEAYLRLLQFYENKNIPIINSSQSIIKCQDKFRTHYCLAQNGIPTPKTFITYEYKSGIKLLDEGKLNFPFVIKKIYGSRGTGVYKVDSFKSLERLHESCFDPKEVLFYQEFLYLERNRKGEVRDYRVWVVRDKRTGKPKTLGAVHRNAKSSNFLTNSSHGGYVTEIKNLSPEISDLGERALATVSADVAGVDIARTTEGRLFVEEINISFETGPRTQIFIGDIWSEVIDLLIARIEAKKEKSFSIINSSLFSSNEKIEVTTA
ncbi:MAG: YheC/YheD family protein [Acidobacteriota bacterium]